MPSKGVMALELSVNMLWQNGPSWLSESDVDREQQVFQMPVE